MGQGCRGRASAPADVLNAEPAVEPALHSMRVVKEQALRVRSGAEAAPAAEKQKARFLGRRPGLE